MRHRRRVGIVTPLTAVDSVADYGCQVGLGPSPMRRRAWLPPLPSFLARWRWPRPSTGQSSERTGDGEERGLAELSRLMDLFLGGRAPDRLREDPSSEGRFPWRGGGQDAKAPVPGTPPRGAPDSLPVGDSRARHTPRVRRRTSAALARKRTFAADNHGKRQWAKRGVPGRSANG